MLRKLTFTALCVLISACSPEPEIVPEFGAIPLRNPTAVIASQADVTLERMLGDWVIVSSAGLAPADRLSIKGTSIQIGAQTLPFAAIDQGRFEMNGKQVWVHWMDIDDRTAALGAPDGTAVWIMDRSGKPGERANAARKILAWYGYDLSRMARP